jgi:hypothetical protein
LSVFRAIEMRAPMMTPKTLPSEEVGQRFFRV